VKHALLLSLCFLPLAIIYVIMKVSVWLSSSVSEIKYVKDDAKRPHGSYVENAYADIDERKRVLETKEVIEQAIWEWYFERGLEVPNWKMQKNPKWWTDYLASLDDEQ
jgi:hypothetical protein